MSDSSSDDIAELLVFMTLAAIIIVVWVAAIKYKEWADQEAMRREAAGVFNRVRAETTPDLKIDPLIKAIFGQDLDLSHKDSKQPSDWLTQVIFSTE